MKKACLVVSDYYQKNKIFDINDKIVNRDNCLYSFYLLKKKLADIGIDLATQDINSILDSDYVIYNDMPIDMPKLEHINKSYLILSESEGITPRNWDKKLHENFRKIFTWKKEIVDNKKYFHVYWSQKIPDDFAINYNSKPKFCTLIAGNKTSNFIGELYTERKKAIKWFEQNYPDQFDLYGFGWDTFKGKWSKLNRFSLLRKINAKLNFPSYKGIVASKRDVLLQYKFSICYENMGNITGYITEKIFDSMFAGCIPIYLGAPDIEQYIPTDCFIDKRKYKTYEDLYDYLINLSDEEYIKYLNAIKKFVKEDNIGGFNAEKFVETFIRELLL